MRAYLTKQPQEVNFRGYLNDYKSLQEILTYRESILDKIIPPETLHTKKGRN